MWISEKLREKTTADEISRGTIISTEPNLSVSGENSLGEPIVIQPYGLCSSLPVGTSVAVYQGAVLGVVGNGSAPVEVEVEEGEICLYSKGGYILIKNSGEIIINGETLEV